MKLLSGSKTGRSEIIATIRSVQHWRRSKAMGGYGSGQHGGAPTVDSSLRIDLAWMLRKGLAREGQHLSGSLNWTCGGEPSGSISYSAIMDEAARERIELSYFRGSGEDREHIRQSIRLSFTRPPYGGRRWWICSPPRHEDETDSRASERPAGD